VTVRLPEGGIADGRRRRGVANIGRRPTVDAGHESRLEVNLFDFEGDLYGEELEVSLHAFLRAERRFAGLDELRAQIAADAAEARRVLDHAVPPFA
jgi:riboflavin kinase/FMN adenylyltransferase